MTQVQTTNPGRRPAAGTAEAATQAIAEAAAGWPAMPTCLGTSEVAAALWQAVMVARLPSQWHRIDLQHAANLVRCLRDIDEHDAAMQREGLMLGKGSSKHVNPRHVVVDSLNRRAAMLTRLLTLHSVPLASKEQRDGMKSEAGKAANVMATVGSPAANFNADDLIARPRPH